jgi:putative component of toxin-antitoxin plasmid stabilization module
MAGEERILGEERVRKLMVPSSRGQPEVWEFKAHDGPGWRLYAIRWRGDWVVTHGRKKPPDRRVAAEAAKARMLYAGWRDR